jgi:hypothetical protein
MAYNGGLQMTNEELIAWEAKVRHLFHGIERKVAKAKEALEEFADLVAADRGIDPAARSGGDDKPPQ